jgi:hypothetical protein
MRSRKRRINMSTYDRSTALVTGTLVVALLLTASATARETTPLVDVAIVESGKANVTAEVLIAEKGASPAKKIASARAVATIALRNGATLEFIDTGDGDIDVAERTAHLLPFVSQEMLLRWNATPLEIFRTLNPGALAPQALAADHYRRTAGSEPRDLTMPASATFTFGGGGLEPYICDPFGDVDNWVDDWKAQFAVYVLPRSRGVLRNGHEPPNLSRRVQRHRGRHGDHERRSLGCH